MIEQQCLLTDPSSASHHWTVLIFSQESFSADLSSCKDYLGPYSQPLISKSASQSNRQKPEFEAQRGRLYQCLIDCIRKAQSGTTFSRIGIGMKCRGPSPGQNASFLFVGRLDENLG